MRMLLVALVAVFTVACSREKPQAPVPQRPAGAAAADRPAGAPDSAGGGARP